MKKRLLLGAIMILSALGCESLKNDVKLVRAPLDFVNKELEKFAPVDLQVDLSGVSEADRQALAKLVEAAKIIDELFLVQVYPENLSIKEKLAKSSQPDDKYYLQLYNVMFGPWDRLEHEKPFLIDKEKPAGAGFYPEDMSKEEFQQAIQNNPDMAKNFEANFTIIRRENGELTAIHYHVAYKPQIEKISSLLKDAAELTEDPTLKEYLRLRAQAFLTDDYFDSDMAWMDLAGDLEIVIGPYEVYEDNLFNYKASYEAFLCVVDHEESKKLDIVSGYLNNMESNLPIPNEYKNFARGSSSPIKVANEIFSAGDTKAGVQTTAFNLPNDERVREAKGSKKVMLKNVAHAKYDKCWVPIVNTILAEKPLKAVSFDSYFNHVLMHEMSHGLGPGNIVANGKETTVAKELKELYSVIEECKADVLGIYNMKFMMDKGVFPKDEFSMYASYLGGMLRSIRFGINEAHGGGVAIQFNYYFEKGAYKSVNGKLDFDETKILPAVTNLARELLMLQAKGDYNAAKDFVEKYRKTTPAIQDALDRLNHVPVDIRPNYPAIDKLLEPNV